MSLGLCPADFLSLDAGLPNPVAELMSENVIGTFALPFAIACNFVVDNRPALVPMVTEEPSIVAAVSRMGKLLALNGGFRTTIDPPLIKGQVQIYGLIDSDLALKTAREHRAEFIAFLNEHCQNMVKRGGGAESISERLIGDRQGHAMLLIEPTINVCDAMGANLVNTLMEALAKKVKNTLRQGEIGLRILSNFSDCRLATAECALPFQALATDECRDFGQAVATRMSMAHKLAEVDIYRATTHNKGIMNGIDAVAIATGNDFRALEAGAHAYAASQPGGYKALTTMEIDEARQMLKARLRLPLAIGVVGGNTKTHPQVRIAQKILGWHGEKSERLASVMVSVGLAQCLAAVHALSSEGIQRGHMKLHHRKTELINLVEKK